MGLIESASAEVRGLDGLHLYHCFRSACSARVRLLLEEKRLPWTSHHVDLFKKENIDEAYFAINPKGLVPVLIDDGQVVAESDDIMLWLERRYPETGFTPEDASQRAAMEDWVRLAGQGHIASVKTYAYAKVNAKAAAKTPEEAARYRALQSDPELLEFHAGHQGGAFPQAKLDAALARLERIFTGMEAAIHASGWLAGPRYSLADMAWGAPMVTLRNAGYPLEERRVVSEWFERVQARAAWQGMTARWAEPPAERVQRIEPASG